MAQDSLRLELELGPLLDGHSCKGQIEQPIQIQRCGYAMRLIVPGTNSGGTPDPRLLQAVTQARDWLRRLTSGSARSIAEIAKAEGVTGSYVTRVLYRAFLAPSIVRSIQQGTQPATLTVETFKHITLPLDWQEQRKVLGYED